MFDPECEDLSNVQDVQGQGFNVQGLEDVEDSSLQDDQDDVQHVTFPYFLLLEEGSHF
jgi:hypothetical protein